MQGKGTDQDGMVGVVDFDGREGNRRSEAAKIAGEKVMAVLFSHYFCNKLTCSFSGGQSRERHIW